MHNKGCSCHQGCHGRRYLTREEKKKMLTHKQECLEKELQGIKETIKELE